MLPFIHLLRFRDIHPRVRLAHYTTAPLRVPSRYILDHELILVDRGWGTVYTEQGEFDYREGCLLLIPPGTPHSFRDKQGEGATDGKSGEDVQPFGHWAIHFDWDDGGSGGPIRIIGDEDGPIDPEFEPEEDAVRQSIWLPDLVLVSPVPGDIREKLAAVVRAFGDEADPLRRLRLQADMLALLLGLSRAICDSRVGCTLLTDRHRAPNWLQQERTEMTRYIVLMHEAVSESPVSDAILTEWSRTIHFSYSHFHRLFKEQTGFAPHIYFTNLRMEKAAQLLLRTDLPVQEVAYRCGYDDAKYFSRQFRKSQGMSPTAFRERIRTGRLDDSE